MGEKKDSRNRGLLPMLPNSDNLDPLSYSSRSFLPPVQHYSHHDRHQLHHSQNETTVDPDNTKDLNPEWNLAVITDSV